MSDILESLYYTESHEWVRVEDQLCTVGITDYAQGLLGDIVFVELPEEGDAVTVGNEAGVVESVKAASDLYSPVNGVVESINRALIDAPEQINQDPYGQGWMYRVHVEALDTSELLNADAYKALVDAQDH